MALHPGGPWPGCVERRQRRDRGARPGRATGTVAARPRGGRITSSDEHRTISARQYRRILCHTLINEVVSETA
ncbi:hypothetical protein NK166_002822 [Escherichia coli]|nr:hypothetical protein [Escherichia coli]